MRREALCLARMGPADTTPRCTLADDHPRADLVGTSVDRSGTVACGSSPAASPVGDRAGRGASAGGSLFTSRPGSFFTSVEAIDQVIFFAVGLTWSVVMFYAAHEAMHVTRPTRFRSTGSTACSGPREANPSRHLAWLRHGLLGRQGRESAAALYPAMGSCSSCLPRVPRLPDHSSTRAITPRK